MRIPNKFNGYSRDGIRLYNDPVTLTALTAAGAEGSMAGAAVIPTLAEAAAPAALGILPEATGILPETLGGAQGIMQPAVEASTKAAATQAELAKGVVDPLQAQAEEAARTSAERLSQYPRYEDLAGKDQLVEKAAATPTPGTQPGPMPNVSTTPSPTDAQASAEYYRNALQNAPQTVGGPESGGIMDQLKNFTDPLTSGFQKAMDYAKDNKAVTAAGLYGLSKLTQKPISMGNTGSGGPHADMSKFHAPSGMNPYLYNQPSFHAANGGLMTSYANGGITTNATGNGPVEQMAQQNAVGANTGYPMANQQNFGYANYAAATQNPISQNMLDPTGDARTDAYTGEPKFSKGGTAEDDDNGMSRFRKQLAKQDAEREALGESLYQHARARVEDRGIVSRPLSESSTDPYTASINRMKKANQVAGIKMHEMPKVNMPESFNVTEAAGGGIMHGDLGGYSDGGRLLKGPGDGVSDSIPAVIGNKQPARLADGEFVVPARIVSELGNGSTEAGARKLYAMMERIQKGRRKSVGKGKVAVNSKADKHLPA